jgi:ubiquinone/menaquinone biosynthesis C-methylase UbiE
MKLTHAVSPKLTQLWYHLQHRAMAVLAEQATGLWHRALNPPQSVRSREARQNMHASMRALFEQDLKNVEDGHYPASLIDFPYLEHLAAAPWALFDGPKMLWKRWRGDFADLPREVDLSAYPKYYRRNFHWQPDGWLSEASARTYDFEVEFLFWGAADVMRRMALPTLSPLKSMERPRMLDVACGTGRFLGTVRKVLPQAKLYGVDLSPFYVATARQNVPDANLLVENAERMPLESDSFDAATCIFLFHELPHDARRNVMREVARVLKPGAPFVVIDSLQREDAAAKGLSMYSDWFPVAYHEPYYKGYLADDLRSALAECGLTVESVSAHGVSKVVVARA